MNSAESTNSKRVTVVIPLLNEARHLDGLVGEVVRRVEACGLSARVVLVDDGSTDDTWAVIRQLADSRPEVAGISLARNFGKEAAMLAGLEAADGDAVIVMDGDGQHPPALIADMIAAWRDGADIVEATKTSRRGQAWHQRLMSSAYNRLFSSLTGVDLVGATDYRLLSKPVLEHLLALPERDLFLRGLCGWLGFRQVALPFEPEIRKAGDSRFTLRALGAYAVRSLVSFTSAPLHVVTLAGVGFMVFALVLGAQTLWRWFSHQAVEGFTTVILLLLVQGGVIMLALGIIGQYIGQIHTEIKRRPRYIVRQRTAGPRRAPP